MYNKSNKLVFIHIPKTGGEAISSMFVNNYPEIAKHATALQIRDYLGNEIWGRAFKFSIVRNPWDLVVSMYTHLRKPLYQPFNIKRKYGKLIINPRKACLTALTTNFTQFVNIVYNKNQKQYEENRKQWPIKHFQQQYRWLVDEKQKYIVDYIGRFEDLQGVYSNVLKQIGKPIDLLPKKNSSKRHEYHLYYNSHTKNIIEKYYEEDIEYFKYIF